jgi:hypothetical protein
MTEQLTLTQVEERMDTLRNGVLTEGPAHDDFDIAVAEYTALLTDRRSMQVQANESLIATARVQVGQGIKALVDSLNLAELKQEPITRIVWTYMPSSTDDNGNEVAERTEVSVNVTAPTTTTRRAPRKSSEEGGTTSGRDLVAIFDSGANDAEREAMAALDARHLLPESEDKSLADSKKFNSATWALKNRTANRIDDEASGTKAAIAPAAEQPEPDDEDAAS